MNEDRLRGIVREIFPKRDRQILYTGRPDGSEQSAPEAEQAAELAAELARHTEISMRYTAQVLFQGIDPLDCKKWGVK